MKNDALAGAEAANSPAQKLNLLREYVQAFTLRSWHESEAFHSVAFVGGTALRFLHGLARFSEDLDFSVEDPGRYEPVRWMQKLKRDLELAGFEPELRWNDRKTLHTGWIRLGGLLQEAGLSNLAEQKLSIKIDVDTQPPSGAGVIPAIVTRRLTFFLRHYDLSSLLAGKLHALLVRPYAKGRDWYDFIWYRSHRPPISPNLSLLQNALDQTEGAGACDARLWPQTLLLKIDSLDLAALLRDVQPFLERPADAALFSREHFRALLSQEALPSP